MKRLSTAVKAFMIIIAKRDVSVCLKYGKKKILFEEGKFAATTAFLNTLQKRNNFPDYILNQYKEILADFNYKD